MSRRQFLGLASAAALAMSGCSAGGSSTGGGSTGGGVSSSGSTTSSEQASTSASANTTQQERTLFVFDTVVTLKCFCSEGLMDRAVDRCYYFEEHFSRTLEGSDIWNVNHASGKPVQVAPETADIVGKALTYCERSDGLFDITIGAVTSLWDFQKGVKPEDAAIKEAVRHIDYRGVHVNGDSIQLDDPQAALDLGGIAKGYIADDLAVLFREGGCMSGIINLGGNVYVIGARPDGSPWNVGIQDPNGVDQQIIAKVSCTDASVVTSGLYERAFEQDGVRYYHILDPKTGYPVMTDLVSSSVFGKSSIDGDAYATWMFLLGCDAALALIESTPGLDALVVDEDGHIAMTRNAHFELV